jgi:hypothetical protein
MSLEQAVQSLTQTTENLLVEVNTRKLDLVNAVNQANQAAQTSATQASNAANSATLATEKAAIAAEKATLLGDANIVTATGTVTLTSTSAVYQLVNPNGAARDVVLPTLTTDNAGRAFSVKNTGTAGNFLTIKNAAGVQVGPALGNGYAMALVWSGAQWEAL